MIISHRERLRTVIGRHRQKLGHSAPVALPGILPHQGPFVPRPSGARSSARDCLCWPDYLCAVFTQPVHAHDSHNTYRGVCTAGGRHRRPFGLVRRSHCQASCPVRRLSASAERRADGPAHCSAGLHITCAYGSLIYSGLIVIRHIARPRGPTAGTGGSSNIPARRSARHAVL